MNLFLDLEGETGPAIEHSENDSGDTETRVQALFHQLHSPQKLRKAFECVELALKRHEDPISRNQGIDRQETQRRRAVDDDVVVRRAKSTEGAPQPILSPIEPNELDLRTHEVDIGRQKPQTWQHGLSYRFFGWFCRDESVIDRRIQGRFIDPESCCGVPLGIEIDKKGRALGQG